MLKKIAATGILAGGMALTVAGTASAAPIMLSCYGDKPSCESHLSEHPGGWCDDRGNLWVNQ
ncbi:putative phage protein [Nocardia nova SH22a]|uniref:Putative phage protein n=1 Tax=Nocardia nova SH22a TaxID=1415166 RepID=W5TQJ4_9NOCA|nr:hypothetical protein [Nocardia nova]AHH21228.1 putative phage protein [Nocardia nova SH22a]